MGNDRLMVDFPAHVRLPEGNLPGQLNVPKPPPRRLLGLLGVLHLGHLHRQLDGHGLRYLNHLLLTTVVDPVVVVAGGGGGGGDLG